MSACGGSTAMAVEASSLEPALGSAAASPEPPPPIGWEADSERSEPEKQLARLAAAFGPLRRALAAIAERLLATKAPDRLCYARVSDYARERPGLSVRQLQELARVHRALAGLPALERALVANQLPWSKVRLIARIATAEDEEAWIATAPDLPTRALERRIKAASGKGEQPQAGDEPLTQIRVRCTPAVAEKWRIAREFAERVAGQRVCAGEALELVAAEVFSAISIDPAFARMSEEPLRLRCNAEDSSLEAAPPAARAMAQDLPCEIASLVVGLDEADAIELDQRLCRAVQLEQTLDAAMAPLLRIVRCAEYEWSTPYYQTLSDYARNHLGISPSKARALVRLERACEVCPELREAYRSGRISWVKAQCLFPLLLLDVDGEYRPIWVEWAERVTVRRLAADVERMLLLRAGHPLAWHRCKFHPEQAQDPIPPDERQLCAPDIDTEATQELVFRVPHDVAALFRAVRETLRGRLRPERGRWLLDGEVFDAMLDGALLTWTLREPRSRAPDPVIEREGYRCAVPGCTSRRNLHDHHVIFRSHQGSDDASNRITLCAFHHQRCVHMRLMRIRGLAPDTIVFELPVASYRYGDVAVSQAEASRLEEVQIAA